MKKSLIAGLAAMLVWGGGWPGGDAPKAQASDTMVLKGTVRDFQDSHPRFREMDRTGFRAGDAHRKPVHAGKDSPAISSEESFRQWYNNDPKVNESGPIRLSLTSTAQNPALFKYESSSFFPIDSQYFGNQNRSHNYHFTMDLHASFTYRGGETLSITGDDDIWVFINNKLVIDMGGVHGAVSAQVNLDDLVLNRNEVYSFDLFMAERHTTQSNFKMYTTMGLFTPYDPIPEAHAGEDRTVEADSPGGVSISLHGGKSQDLYGDALSYSWSWSEGSAEGVNPAVTLPVGVNPVRLTVSDGNYSSTAYVRKARLNFLERTDLVLHLIDKNTGQFVGSSGLHRFDWNIRKF